MNVTQMEIHKAENGFVITYVDSYSPGMGLQRLHVSRDLDFLLMDIRQLFAAEPTPVPASIRRGFMPPGAWQQPEQVSSLPAEVAPAPDGSSEVPRKPRYKRRDE